MEGPKKNKLPPFVAIEWSILNSPAYWELPPSAAKALPYFLGKVKHISEDPFARYTTEFAFSYREAGRYGFSKSTFSKVIDDLVQHGFIDPVRKGGQNNGTKVCSKFVLSIRWRDYGKVSFDRIVWWREKRKQTSETAQERA